MGIASPMAPTRDNSRDAESCSILQELRGIAPRGACLTWPDAYVYGDNGSYRRGLPQPVDRPSACVLKVWWAVARTHLISLQTVNSPYRCPTTRWWRTAGMVGHYLRVTPGFFCCQRVYSVVKRDLTQCCGSATRAPHWQFLLENRDEKSSGSGSQNQGKLTFLAPSRLYAKLWLDTCSPPYHIYGGH